MQIVPMPLLKRAAPFDDPAWIFELKYDGFRALAVIEHGRVQLLSRNGHPFASFSALAESISDWRSAQRMWQHGVRWCSNSTVTRSSS
jgi:bifunctional non-homologous end joining protein LigD